MANPLQTQLGTLPTFRDGRQAVQDNSKLVAEQEQRRQLTVDLNERLAGIESNSNMFNALGTVGIKLGEVAAINAFYGSADNEAEAIAQISEKGFQMAEVIDNVTKLAQARSGSGTQNGMSYGEAQNKLALLLRNAKNDNPLFAYVFDEAAAKFVNGTPTGRGSSGGNANSVKGTLASLSVAEQAQVEFMSQAAAIKLKAPSLTDHEVESYLHRQQLRKMDVERMDYYRNVSKDYSNSIEQDFSMFMGKLADDAWIEMSAVADKFAIGMPTEVKQAMSLQIQSLRSTANQELQRAITHADEMSEGTFILTDGSMEQMQSRLNSELASLQAFVDDADFNKNMVAIHNANESAYASYLMTNNSEFYFMKEIFFEGDAVKMTLAFERNDLLEATLRQSPILRKAMDDYGMTTNEGVSMLVNNAHMNVFTQVYEPDDTAVSADTTNLNDSTAVVSSQVDNPDLADRGARALGNPTGKLAVTNLAKSAAQDPDMGMALTSLPAYIERGNADPKYAAEVLTPILTGSADGILNSITIDSNGANPNLEIEWVGSNSATIVPNPSLNADQQKLVSRFASQYDGYHLKVEGISKTQQRHLDELYTSLQNNPNAMGISPDSSLEEIRDAAQNWITNQFSPVLQQPEEQLEE